MINTGDNDENPEQPSGEGDQVAERSLAEASRAHSLEEKEKMLNAVRQNVD